VAKRPPSSLQTIGRRSGWDHRDRIEAPIHWGAGIRWAMKLFDSREAADQTCACLALLAGACLA